jgi:L-2-hydroxyglutarate oxidase LhgO
MSPDFDAIVVGAGVVGLAIARKLAMSGQQVLVLEAAARAGTETSARNSEVIHAGIYYPTNSLKARLCVGGREQLYAFCAEHGVATRRLGKLIVATTENEIAKLESIQAQAIANGVKDLEWLKAADVSAFEPEIKCSAALFSPSTGILDVQGYMLALQASTESFGTTFAFQTAFISAHKSEGLFDVSTRGVGGETSRLTCRILINCAGHGAHAVAAAITGFPVDVLPPRFLAKGSYCSLSGQAPFNHLIYPVPVSGALGIHATLDMAGAVRFGPDIQWVDVLDYAMPAGLAEKFAGAVRSFWPAVASRSLTPSYCGIRPKTHGPDESFADFTIQFEDRHGIANLVNLFGIESPGITASLSIASHVADGLSGKDAK